MLLYRCNAEAAEGRLRVVPSEFLGLIEQVRRDDYAQTRGDVTPTFGAIAVTVPAPIGLMPMAIGVGVPLERIEAKKEAIIASLQSLKLVFTTLSSDADRDRVPPQAAG